MFYPYVFFLMTRQSHFFQFGRSACTLGLLSAIPCHTMACRERGGGGLWRCLKELGKFIYTFAFVYLTIAQSQARPKRRFPFIINSLIWKRCQVWGKRLQTCSGLLFEGIFRRFINRTIASFHSEMIVHCRHYHRYNDSCSTSDIHRPFVQQTTRV